MKNKLFILLIVFVFFEYSYSMDKPPAPGKESEKQAWRLAYSGFYQEAYQHLLHASQAGSLRAALVLHQGATAGNIFLPPNPAQAKVLEPWISKLQNKEFQELLAKETSTKRSNPDQSARWWIEYNLDTLQRRISHKLERVQTHAFARHNPWYQSVIEILAKYDGRFPPQKKFKPPTPDRGICELIRLYKDGKIDAHANIVVNSITRCKSEKVATFVLEMLTESYRKQIAIPYRKNLLAAVHPATVNTPLASQLAKAYATYIDDHHWNCMMNRGEPRDKAYYFQEILNTFPAYFQVNAQAAGSQLNDFTQRYAVEKLGHFHQNQVHFEDLPLRLLLLMRTYHNTKFDEYARSIVCHNSDMFLALAFAHPNLADQFAGTILDINALIEKTLISKKEAFDSCHHPFKVILIKGSAYHVRYQEQIAAQLPIFFKYSCDSHLLIKLLDSPSEVLRQRSLELLIELASKVPQEKIMQNVEEQAQQRLIKDLINRFSADQAFAPRLFDTLKKYDNHIGIQAMIVNSIPRDENVSAYLWQELICSYLNVSPDVVATEITTPNPSPRQYMSTALSIAQQCNSINTATIKCLLHAASQTGLNGLISPQVSTDLSRELILDETAPLSDRVKLLDALCTQNSRQPHLTERIISRLSESAFKEYALTMMALLQSSSSCHTTQDHYARLRKLSELHEQHPELPAVPAAFIHRFGEPYNPLSGNRAEASLVLLDGGEHFTDTQLSDHQLLFGYVLNDTGHYSRSEEKTYYRLYAYTSKGLPLWSSPYEQTEVIPFRLFGQHLFCPTPQNTIVQYDQATGTIITQIPLPELCHQLFITPKGILYSIGEKYITLYDIATKQIQTISYPPASSTYFANTAGQRLVFPTAPDNNLFILNPDGTSSNLHTGLDSCDDPSPSAGTDQYLLYNAKENKQEFLTCFDYAANTIAWKYPIACPLQKPVIILPDQKRYFVLTKKMLIALEVDQEHGALPRTLWRMPITAFAPDTSYAHFENIFLAPDHKTILVTTNLIEDAHVIQINSENGQFQILGTAQIDWGITLRCVGTQNGKVYIEHKRDNHRSCL